MMKKGLITVVVVLEMVAAAVADNAPIGMFDSGVGGLTVLEQMLAMDLYDNATGERHPDGRPDFERERFVYFGDQANMPYGDYSAGHFHWCGARFVIDKLCGGEIFNLAAAVFL
jgi:hypothetical protein